MPIEQHEDEETKNMKVIVQTSLEAALADMLNGSTMMIRELGLSHKDGLGIMGAALGKMLFKLCEVGVVRDGENMDVHQLDRVLRSMVHIMHAIARDLHPEQMNQIIKAAQGSVSDEAIAAFKAKINRGLN